MRIANKFVNLSHDDIRAIQNGQWHLSVDELTKLHVLHQHLHELGTMFPSKLFAWGPTTPSWSEPENTDLLTPRELALPVDSRPEKVTTANQETFLVRLANGDSYAWGRNAIAEINGELREVPHYILNSETKFSYTDMPVRFQLGNWLDVKLPLYWLTTRETFEEIPGLDENNNAIIEIRSGCPEPDVLLDTSTHLALPDVSQSLNVVSIQYTDTGDGINVSLNDDTIASFAIPSGAAIKRMSFAMENQRKNTIQRAYFMIYAADGLYVPEGQIDFLFGEIKDAWPAGTDAVYVQNTDRHVFKGIVNHLANYIEWAYTGQFDIVKIAGTEFCNYLLTPDGRLYYNGEGHEEYNLPNTRVGEFMPILEDYRFLDIACSGLTCMGIGRKAN